MRYMFAVEGCAEHFEHPDDETAMAAAHRWAETGLYDAETVEVGVWENERHVGTFTMTVSEEQRA